MWGFESASSDVERYRKGYPGKRDDLKANKNLLFYQNKIRSEPDGDLIDTIHKEWYGDYSRLEMHHGYIQWLFPIREHGMNMYAQELQQFEAQGIKGDADARKRVVLSYRLMLDFYGMQLIDEESGKVGRKEKGYEMCYDNLEKSSHNWLRVTRILKCLGELGFEQYKRPFLEHLVREIHQKNLMRCMSSLINYWIPVLKSDADRKLLLEFLKDKTASPTRLANAAKARKEKRRKGDGLHKEIVDTSSNDYGICNDNGVREAGDTRPREKKKKQNSNEPGEIRNPRGSAEGDELKGCDLRKETEETVESSDESTKRQNLKTETLQRRTQRADTRPKKKRQGIQQRTLLSWFKPCNKEEKER